ncbi:Protein of unknown function [Gryllus bimaculatus]|nr:Protein of unknown function [Gryllus bimaculatus]
MKSARAIKSTMRITKRMNVAHERTGIILFELRHHEQLEKVRKVTGSGVDSSWRGKSWCLMELEEDLKTFVRKLPVCKGQVKGVLIHTSSLILFDRASSGEDFVSASQCACAILKLLNPLVVT